MGQLKPSIRKVRYSTTVPWRVEVTECIWYVGSFAAALQKLEGWYRRQRQRS